MADSRTSNAIKNSGASLLNKVIQILFQFVMRTVFIHILGIGYTGVSGLFTDILHVLSLMEMGLDSSMVFALYKPLSERDEYKISALLKFYRRAFNLIGLLVLVAGAACVPLLKYIIKDAPNISESISGIFLMYVATSAFSYFLIYKTVLLRADQQSRIISIWTSIFTISESLLEIVLLAVLRKFYAYLIVRLAATVLKNLVLSYVTTKRYPGFFKRNNNAQLSKQEKRILYRDLACLTVYNLSGVVINSTDSIFISAFVGTAQVAIIGNFTLIINGVRLCVNQVVDAVKPSIGNLAATSSTDKQKDIFNKLNFVCFWISCFCCVALYSLMNPFVGTIWFNASYMTTKPIVAVMVANFFIAVMVFPVESFRNANGLFVQGWLRPAIMAVMNIVLDFVMGKRWGIIGIFYATTISRLLTQVWYDPYLVYKIVFNKKVFTYIKEYIIYAFITAACCVITGACCNMVRIANAYVSFIVQVFIVVLIPNAVVYLLFRKTDEWAYLRGKLSGIVRKIRKAAHI